MSVSGSKVPGAWEETFRSWAQPASKTEEQRCENAVNAVKNAIGRSAALRQRDIHVFVQGSYRNNTNTRRESDVDIGVLCRDVAFLNLPAGLSMADVGMTDASYTYQQFKADVGQALVDHFGIRSVTRGNKAFDVKENSYHVEADVAPFFEHRRYRADSSYIAGVELRPDSGGKVINWPEQHYSNGVAKNNQTGRRYKAMVRVLKSLRNTMCDERVQAAMPIAGFLNECLVWNVPNDRLGADRYYDDLREVIVFLYNATKGSASCSNWGEVSDLKYLFRPNQKWTVEQVNAFLVSAWQFVGFE